jgi:hypothetical protein
LLASLPAHAQSTAAERSYALDYRAPASCPDAAAVKTAIESRTSGAQAVEPRQASVRFTLELRQSGDEALWVDLPEGSFRRQFHAESCAEAVASMAVIAVMVLEAAPAERRAMAEFPATAVVPAPAAAEPTESAPAAEEPLVPPLPESLPRPLPAALELSVPPTVDRSTPVAPGRLRWAAFAGGALETAVAPSPPVGFSAGLESWLPASGWWSPGLRLSVLSTTPATVRTADGEAEFLLIAARLAACPVRRAWRDLLRVIPCADLELGSLVGEGGGKVLNPVSASMLWLAPGVSLRTQLALTTAISLEVGAGAKWLPRHDTFKFKPSSLVYQVPSASFDVSGALVARFL